MSTLRVEAIPGCQRAVPVRSAVTKKTMPDASRQPARNDIRCVLDPVSCVMDDGARLMRTLSDPPADGLPHVDTGPRGRRRRDIVNSGFVDSSTQERDEPVFEGFEWASIHPVIAVLPLFTHRHKTVVTQHLQVLRYRRLAQAQVAHHLPHADLAGIGRP